MIDIQGPQNRVKKTIDKTLEKSSNMAFWPFYFFKRIFSFFWNIYKFITISIGTLVLFSIFSIFYLISSLSSTEEIQKGDPQKIIAVVDFNGEISSSDIGLNTINVDKYIDALDDLDKSKNVKAIILRINSPGGEAEPSHELADKIRSIQKHKPVYVYVRGLCASGAYFFSSQAKQIYANDSSLIGSIGVIMTLPNVEGLMQKVGVDFKTIKSGKYKDIGSPFRDMSEEEEEIFKSLIMDEYNIFVDYVASGRKLDKQFVLNLANGNIYSAKKSLELKLIDKISSFDDMLADVKKQENLENAMIQKYKVYTLPDVALSKMSSLNITKDVNSVLKNKIGKMYFIYSPGFLDY